MKPNFNAITKANISHFNSVKNRAGFEYFRIDQQALLADTTPSLEMIDYIINLPINSIIVININY